VQNFETSFAYAKPASDQRIGFSRPSMHSPLRGIQLSDAILLDAHPHVKLLGESQCGQPEKLVSDFG